MNVSIYPILLGIERCYLIKGEGIIMIDGGAPKRIGRIEKLLPTLGKVALAATLMGVVLCLIPANLFISILVGPVVYLGALKVFAKEEAEIFIGWILRRK